MSANQITVGQPVTYQRHEDDTDCQQGRGIVKAIYGNIIAIVSDPGQGGPEEIHRELVDQKLMITR